MSATAPFDAPERAAEFCVLPVAAGTTIYAGTLVAIDAAGNAVLASNTVGLRVVGRAEEDVVAGVNSFRGDATLRVKRGCFRYANSSTSPVVAATVGKVVFVEDSQTVAVATSNSIKAGVVIDVDSSGVYIETRSVISG